MSLDGKRKTVIRLNTGPRIPVPSVRMYAYVEHARYFGCRGTGDFEGQEMRAWLNNEANPGLPIVDGVAKIW